MNVQIKHRLVGALVLVAAAIILWPMLFEDPQNLSLSRQSQIPSPPPFEKFRVLRHQSDAMGERTEKTPESGRSQLSKQSMPTKSDSKNGKKSVVWPENEDSTPRLDGTGLPVAWVIQVASFAKQENAEKLKRRLRAQKFQAYTRQVSTSQGKAVRVFVGPKLNKNRAEQVKQRLDKAFKLNTMIVRFES